MAGTGDIVIKKKKTVSHLITANSDIIALRIPNNLVSLQLIKHFKGIVGPSANMYNKVSPTSKQDVLECLGHKVDFILEGGKSKVGIESTIINIVNEKKPLIVRTGMITKSILEEKIGCEFHYELRIKNIPGQSTNHYQPNANLLIANINNINSIVNYFIKLKARIGLLGFNFFLSKYEKIVHIKTSRSERLYAKDMYKNIRTFDRLFVDIILVENVPDGEKWMGIKDRLTKSSLKNSHDLYNFGLN